MHNEGGWWKHWPVTGMGCPPSPSERRLCRSDWHSPRRSAASLLPRLYPSKCHWQGRWPLVGLDALCSEVPVRKPQLAPAISCTSRCSD